MIRVTRLDGSELVVNSDLLETVERTPDTVISLLNGRKLVVRESVEEVISRVIDYHQKGGVCALMQSHTGAAVCAARSTSESPGGVNK